MTDILRRQQAEKAAVKEAVAKWSLQEIQQQQEFEEWLILSLDVCRKRKHRRV
jgi:hypothetical protein